MAPQEACGIQAPEVLRQLHGWLVWKSESDPKRAKPRKVPYYCGSGKRRSEKHGSPDDRGQLVDFASALETFRRGSYTGLGFAPMPDWGLCILDFDQCVNGKVDPRVEALVTGTYAELSPSGTGVHAFVKADLPDMKSTATKERFGIEVFQSAGFVTFTGQILDACHLFSAEDVVAPASESLLAAIEERRKERRKHTPSGAADQDPAGHQFRRELALRNVTAETLADLRNAIESGYLDDYAEGYDDWVDVGLALKSLERTMFAEEARELWHAFSSRSHKYSQENAEAKWSGFSPTEITFTSLFHWAQLAGWTNPRSLQTYAGLEDRTDKGNANLLIRLTAGDLAFVPERRSWIWWDGSAWIPDNYGSHANTAALRVAEHYRAKMRELERQAKDASLAKEECQRIADAAESLAKWVARCRNKRTIEDMLAMASKDARVVVPAASLDTDPWLFGVANGVVDLRTGQLREAARDEYVTKRSPIAFDSRARAPRWLRFIGEITGAPLPVQFDEEGLVQPGSIGKYRPRPDLAAYLQRALGYCLTGTTVEHKLFVALGAGANGKNVLLDTVMEVVGDYGKTIPPEALMALRQDADAERPTSTAAGLAGCRLAVSSESKDGHRLDVALVKRHTGGGFMTARLMRENAFTFTITHKLWLMTNHKPGLDHLDDALRGRLHLIPFDRAWNRPGHPARNEELPDGDKDLMEQLKTEEPGILAWLVEGAARYRKEGLEPPEEVKRLTVSYFAEADPIGRWLEQWERCDPRQGVKASKLFENFCSWNAMQGSGSNGTATAFALALGSRYGVRKCLKKSGTFYGLKPKNADDPRRVVGGDLW